MDLADHPFFQDVNVGDIGTLIAASEIKIYEDEDIIFEEGAPSDALVLVLQGRVSFRKAMPSDEWLTVGFSEVGSYFGEIGVLTGDPRSLRAVAEGHTLLAHVPRSSLMHYMQSMPGPIESIFRSVIKHLHETTRHYVEDMLHREKMAVVGSMVNTVIHDFKNPFCLISLSAQLIRQNHDDPETERLCLNVENQIERMINMATEIAEFSRGEEAQLQKTKVDLQRLFVEFQQLNFPYFENELITIHIELPRVTINGDKSKLLRLFQNLVDNAIEAIGDEKGRIDISGKVKRPEGMVEIQIRDSGGGIPKSIRARFFEPFVTYGKSQGTGLGTAIAKSIVEAHGGSIHFDTAEGEGTIFYINLPLA